MSDPRDNSPLANTLRVIAGPAGTQTVNNLRDARTVRDHLRALWNGQANASSALQAENALTNIVRRTTNPVVTLAEHATEVWNALFGPR